MENQKKVTKLIFGLVGKNISYSFSKGYFSNKFKQLNLVNHQYVNFDLVKIEELQQKVQNLTPYLKGLNVTIPYKQEVLQQLDDIDIVAKEIGAINTIKITNKGLLIGFNTDVVGFRNSITPLLKPHHTQALILGTGGASRAVSFVFDQLRIDYRNVSRSPSENHEISYSDVTKELLEDYTVIVNCSPVGTFPNVTQKPLIPYQYLTENHLLYDLIYNPEKTAFLKEGEKKGSQIKNGFEMLELQAEESWKIWNQ